MANIKITELPEELDPQGSEYMVIDDGTTTKKVKMENIIALAGGTIGYEILPDSIYKFYDEDENELTDISVAGLEDAYYYTKNGGTKQRVGGRIFYINSNIAEGTADKFYAYDTEADTTTYVWSSSDKVTGIDDIAHDGIGLGKTNTQEIMQQVTDGSLWTFIQSLNNSNHLGCNDWFVGSKVEYDMLRTSGISSVVDTFFSETSRQYPWSSVEYSYDAELAWFWYSSHQNWDNETKNDAFCVVALRAF